LRKAVTEQSQAIYQGTVANYRQTVLTAFQEVEDNLSTLRILSQELQQQNVAVASSQRYLNLANVRYQSGMDIYLNVIVAQTALLNNQRTALNLQMEQLTASVQLIKALGGRLGGFAANNRRHSLNQNSFTNSTAFNGYRKKNYLPMTRGGWRWMKVISSATSVLQSFTFHRRLRTGARKQSEVKSFIPLSCGCLKTFCNLSGGCKGWRRGFHNRLCGRMSLR
jgi:hypothetical protein